jgi:tryptophan-rich sensory protein
MKSTARPHSLFVLAGLSIAVAGAALVGSRVSPPRGEADQWYKELEKPRFTPPGAVFPVVWPVLYALMTASAYRVWRSGRSPSRSRSLVLWWTQLAFNAAWSPLFFGAHRPRAALVDLMLLVASLAAYARESGRVDRSAAGMIAPYLAWVCFAAVLNREIVRRNG